MTLPTDMTWAGGLSRSVVVIGGGQAGLSMSWHLRERGIDHVVLESRQGGGGWAGTRSGAFWLVTPHWQCRLPGFGYRGADPDGFMSREQIIGYLRAYLAAYDFPLAEGVTATRLRQAADGTFRLATTHGELTAGQVVVATGPYQVPRTP